MKKKRKKNLIFRNFALSSFKNKGQIFIMTFLTLIVGLLILLLTFSSQQLFNNKQQFESESKLHDFIVDVQNANYYNKNSSNETKDILIQKELEDLSLVKNNQFWWSRIETKNFYATRNNQENLFKLVGYSLNSKVDKLVITKGYNLGQNPNVKDDVSKQIVLDATFAKLHNVKINDIIRIVNDDIGNSLIVHSNVIKANYKWFRVVGFGDSANYEAPILDYKTSFPNKNIQGIGYIDQKDFGIYQQPTFLNDQNYYNFYNPNFDDWNSYSNVDNEIYYACRFKPNANKNLTLIKQYLQKKHSNLFPDSKKWYKLKKIISFIDDYFSKNPLNANKFKQNYNNKTALIKAIKTKILNCAKAQSIALTWNNLWSLNLFKNNKESFDFNDVNSWSSLKKIIVVIKKYNNTYIQSDTNLWNPNNFLQFNLTNWIKGKTKTNNVTNNNKILNLSNQVVNDFVSKITAQIPGPFPTLAPPFFLNNALINVTNNNNYNFFKNFLITNIVNNDLSKYNNNTIDLIKKQLNKSLDVILNVKKTSNLDNAFLNVNKANIYKDIQITLKLRNPSVSAHISSYNFESKINLSANNYHYFKNINSSNQEIVFSKNDKNYFYYQRTNLFNVFLNGYNIYLGLIFLIFVIVSVICISLIIKKIIAKNKYNLGLLKSLGENKYYLAASFISVPLVNVSIAAIFIYPLTIVFQLILNNFFALYFNLGNLNINWISTIYMFFITLAIILFFYCFVTFVVAFIYLNKKPLSLLEDVKVQKVHCWTIALKKYFNYFNFYSKFSLTILLQSFSKIYLVIFSIFIGSFLLLAAFFVPNIFRTNLDYMFIDQNYNNLTSYNEPVWNSPFSFLKYYNVAAQNENKTKLIPKKNDNYFKYFSDINKMGNDIFTPDPTQSTIDLGMCLKNLNNKTLSNAFLNKLKSLKNKPNEDSLIAGQIWVNDYPQISQNIKNEFSATNYNQYLKTNLQVIYNLYRNFYIKYKNSLNLNVNPYFIQDNNITSSNVFPGPYKQNIFNYFKDNLSQTETISFNSDQFKFWTNFIKSSFTFKDNKNQLTINNDQKIIANSFSSLNSKDQKTTAINFIKTFNAWFLSVFYGRLSTGIVEEVYSKAPFSVRIELKKKLENFNNDYNLEFNLVNFNPNKEELATMLNANYNNKNFKIYGIHNNDKYQGLFNFKKKNLNKLLNINFNSKTANNNVYPVVINESMAKLFNLKLNQEFNSKINNYSLNNKNKALDIGNSNNSSDFGNFNPNNFVSADNRDFNYDDIYFDKNHTTPIYNSGPFGRNADYMSEQVALNNFNIDSYFKKENFKVVGISENYGAPKVYINNFYANHLLNYDKTQIFFLKLFNKQWSLNPPSKFKFQPLNFNSSFQLHKYFLNPTSSNQEKEIKAFFNEYPIFNYKMSSSKYNDLNFGLGVNSKYGDYSAIGLNGGLAAKFNSSDPNLKYNFKNLSNNEVKKMAPKDQILKILNYDYNQIEFLVWDFALLAFIMTFLIITSVTSMIINENKKIIVQMKILGFSNSKITFCLFNFYIPIIFFIYVLIYPLTWFLLKFILNNVLTKFNIALALFFNFSIPFFSFALLLIMYLTNFLFNFYLIKNSKLIKSSSEK